METIKVDYLELCPNDKDTHIKVEIYYDRDAWDGRGYYLSVSPIKRKMIVEDMFSEEYRALSGYKQILLEVTRKSKKAEVQALTKVEEWKNAMIERILSENGYTLA